MATSITTDARLNLKELLWIVFILLFAGLIRIPSLTQPLGPDQGVISVIGEGILNGELPYRDYWEMGSPAIFYTYALMFKLFGVHMAAIPITDALVSMFTTFLIFLLARSIWDKKTGYMSALFFAFFSNGVRLGMHAGGDVAFGTFWYIAQRETFILPLTVASIYFLLSWEKQDKKWWQLIFSGFLSGLAFVYKFPTIFIFACVIIYLNWSLISNIKERNIKRIFGKNLILIAGFILALVPFVVMFIINGALREMIDAVFKYVYSVYGQIEHSFLGTLRMGLMNTFFVAKENFILWIFTITSCIFIIKNDRSRQNMLVMIWALAAAVFVISHREFFGYHYLVIFPPFALLTGYGFVKALGPRIRFPQMFTSDVAKVFIVFALVANLVIFASLNHTHYSKFYFYASGKISQDEYYDFFNSYPKHDYSFPADYEVARFIMSHTQETDLIYILGGIEGTIYFLTKRKSPSRFIFSWIIFSHKHSQVKRAELYRQELLADLKTKTPKYIVSIRSIEEFKPFSEIYSYLKNNFALQKTFRDDRFLYVNRKYE